MPDPIILYGTAWCPMVPPTVGLLKQAKVNFRYVDIDADEEAKQKVILINQGNASVPTIAFPDGTALTEPSTAALSAKLEQMGYKVTWLARLYGNIYVILILAAILFAVLRAFHVF